MHYKDLLITSPRKSFVSSWLKEEIVFRTEEDRSRNLRLPWVPGQDLTTLRPLERGWRSICPVLGSDIYQRR
jgi:hypothetical protein